MKDTRYADACICRNKEVDIATFQKTRLSGSAFVKEKADM